MATLAELVKSRRESNQGIGSSLAGSIRDKIKEKFDIRKIFNQTGLLVALFPKLKAFTAKPVPSDISPSQGDGLNPLLLQRLSIDTQIAAKNFLVLPAMHRDINVMRQNIGKLLKLEGETPRTKADAWFKKSKFREEEYENKINFAKKVEDVTKKPKKDLQFLKDLLIFSVVGLGLSLISSDAFANINPFPDLFGGGGTSGSGLKFNELTREEQERLLDAQAKMEGKGAGQVVDRLNNPGGMKFAEWQKEYGATKDESGFAKFPSMEKGRAAQRRLWEKTYGDMPIEDAIRKWAPDSSRAYSETIYKAIGRQASTTSGSGAQRISSGYGMRKDPFSLFGRMEMHPGIDITDAAGTPILAAKRGTVVVAEARGNYGNYVLIKHDNGYATGYGHLSSFSVRVGSVVEAGQQIGKMGSTGRSTGPHLHYELRKDGKVIDPSSPGFVADSSPVLNNKAAAKAVGLSEASAEVARSGDRRPRDREVVIQERNVSTNSRAPGGHNNVAMDDDEAMRYLMGLAVG